MRFIHCWFLRRYTIFYWLVKTNLRTQRCRSVYHKLWNLAFYIYVQNYGERNLKDKYVVVIEETGYDVNPGLGRLSIVRSLFLSPGKYFDRTLPVWTLTIERLNRFGEITDSKTFSTLPRPLHCLDTKIKWTYFFNVNSMSEWNVTGHLWWLYRFDWHRPSFEKWKFWHFYRRWRRRLSVWKLACVKIMP